MGNGKEGERNSCLLFMLNLYFCAARFVLVEVEIIYARFVFPGEKDGKKRGP